MKAGLLNHPKRPYKSFFAILGSALLIVLSSASPALAHSDEAKLEVIKEEQSGSLTHHFDVLLTYANDGHQVEGATVTMTAERGGVAAQPPVTLRPVTRKGLYQGEVTVPDDGAWTVKINSDSPRSLLERTQEFVASEASPSTTQTPVASEDAAQARQFESTKQETRSTAMYLVWLIPFVLILGILLSRRRRK